MNGTGASGISGQGKLNSKDLHQSGRSCLFFVHPDTYYALAGSQNHTDFSTLWLKSMPMGVGLKVVTMDKFLANPGHHTIYPTFWMSTVLHNADLFVNLSRK